MSSEVCLTRLQFRGVEGTGREFKSLLAETWAQSMGYGGERVHQEIFRQAGNLKKTGQPHTHAATPAHQPQLTHQTSVQRRTEDVALVTLVIP
jgi:hypothetical protein